MSNPQTCYYGRARPTSTAVKLNTYTPQEGEVIVGILDICNTDSNIDITDKIQELTEADKQL